MGILLQGQFIIWTTVQIVMFEQKKSLFNSKYNFYSNSLVVLKDIRFGPTGWRHSLSAFICLPCFLYLFLFIFLVSIHSALIYWSTTHSIVSLSEDGPLLCCSGSTLLLHLLSLADFITPTLALCPALKGKKNPFTKPVHLLQLLMWSVYSINCPCTSVSSPAFCHFWG